MSNTRTIVAGLVKRIHVNRHRIDANRKRGEDEPVLTVKCARRNHYAREITIHGTATISQRRKPLPCGARVYIETRAAITLED